MKMSYEICIAVDTIAMPCTSIFILLLNSRITKEKEAVCHLGNSV